MGWKMLEASVLALSSLRQEFNVEMSLYGPCWLSQILRTTEIRCAGNRPSMEAINSPEKVQYTIQSQQEGVVYPHANCHTYMHAHAYKYTRNMNLYYVIILYYSYHYH